MGYLVDGCCCVFVVVVVAVAMEHGMAGSIFVCVSFF